MSGQCVICQVNVPGLGYNWTTFYTLAAVTTGWGPVQHIFSWTIKVADKWLNIFFAFWHAALLCLAEEYFKPWNQVYTAQEGKSYVIQRALSDGGARPCVRNFHKRFLWTWVEHQRTGSMRLVSFTVTYYTRLKFVRVIMGLRPTTGEVMYVNIGTIHILHRCAGCVRVDRTVRVIFCINKTASIIVVDSRIKKTQKACFYTSIKH